MDIQRIGAIEFPYPMNTYRHYFALFLCLAAVWPALGAEERGNRLVYLDESDPFYVNRDFAKLTTPQWVGESGVDAVVILAIDDMRDPAKYEAFLRPILDRLKAIDGRAPVSIMSNQLDPNDPQLQSWLQEGLSLEVHTLTHPCPLLANHDFDAADRTYQGSIQLMNRVPGNTPVAFRMPCCDSMNSPSPRFYAEMFNATNAAGQFLTIDSSVMNLTTPLDLSLPRDLVFDADGGEKFRKYVPFPSFATTIEDYPYPYVIGRLCWEFPAMVPSDWEAQHIHGVNNPVTVADWRAALDAAVLKQGTFTFIFHPHGWIQPGQLVEFVDGAIRKYGSRVKFLTFKEAQDRLNQYLLLGRPLRAADGGDNGVRLVDLDGDGFLDVVSARDGRNSARLWVPKEKRWQPVDFPVSLVATDTAGHVQPTDARFGIVDDAGACLLVRNEKQAGAWQFSGGRWHARPELWHGLEIDGDPVLTSREGRDQGVRFRDLDRDGRCELIVGNERQSAVFAWSPVENGWARLDYALPKGLAITDQAGADTGLRFADLNDDGADDLVVSNERGYGIYLFLQHPVPELGWGKGWTEEIISGKRGEPGAVPMIVRGGAHPNNGAWFHDRRLWVQNEDTADLPDKVDRRSFKDLLSAGQPLALSPEDSLRAIQVRPGFNVELVAQEPLVKDPIAFEWGPDGKLWVVEMGDYPQGIDGHGQPGGTVLYLEDVDGDGRYDRSTVFLRGVNFPTGVIPWHKGVIVCAAPDIFYAEDKDGDGKADVRRVLFSGFREGNQQHRLNGFDYGLDNWLYGANGDSGGDVFAIGRDGKPAGERLNLRGRDWRIRPDAGLIETQPGQTQYGRHRDDLGNWFGDNNPNWLWHYFIRDEYLARNPYLAVPSLKRMLANYPNANRLYPASRPIQRFNFPNAINLVTSANSPTPYRDNLFGPDFAGSVFISEPVHNLVHREQVETDGVSFTSHRAAGEEETEFLASRDNWFRPTMLKIGPDGALYIADMYRLVIEHPEWIPQEMQKLFDLRAGAEMGRIYRVYPEGATLRKMPRLDRENIRGLVAALETENGWQRDTAQRLLVEAHDPAAVAPLERLVRNSPSPKTRLQALWTIEGLHGLTPDLLTQATHDAHYAVRAAAVRLSEPYLQNAERSWREARPAKPDISRDQFARLTGALLSLVHDPDLHVRYQLAFSLGDWNDPRAAGALAEIALSTPDQSDIRTAVLSSSLPHLDGILTAVFRDTQRPFPDRLVEQLLGFAAAAGNEEVLEQALLKVEQPINGQFRAWQFSALGGLADALARKNRSLAQLQSSANRPGLRQALEHLEAVFSAAETVARQVNAAPDERAAAVRVVGLEAAEHPAALDELLNLLSARVPGQVQAAAANALGELRRPDVGRRLLEHWKLYGPGLRAQVLQVVFSRPEWVRSLLDALESGRVSTGEIDAPNQQKLLSHRVADVRAKAERLFTSTRADRQEVLKDFASVTELTGHPARGEELFKNNCAVCHAYKGIGTGLGADLAGVADKPVATLLTSILDPNQAVEARYLSYNAVTRSGREISGVISAETPNSITIKGAGGTEDVLMRSDLEELTCSGLSLMPEGFEKAFQPQDLADLIAFIKGQGPATPVAAKP